MVPLPGRRSRYAVVAGSRRLAAVATLIKKGELDAKVPLRCLVKDAQRQLFLSLTTIRTFVFVLLRSRS